VTSSATRQLFSHPYRRSPRQPGAAAGARLLGGQALAEAQRLSRPRMRGQVMVLLLMSAEPVAILLAGLVARAVGAGASGGVDAALLGKLWVGALVYLAAVRLAGGYRLWRLQDLRRGLPPAGLGLVLAMAAVAGVALWTGAAGGEPLPWLGLWAGLSGLAVLGMRVTAAWRLRALIRLGLMEHRLVVVGGGAALGPALRGLLACRGEGYRVCGFFDDRHDNRSPAMVAGLHKTGDLRDLVEFVRIAQVDTVILAIPDLSQVRLVEMLATLSALPVEVRSLPAPGLALPPRARRSRIGQVDLVEVCRPPVTLLQAMQKRAFDLVTATVALVLLAPVMLAVAVAVRLDSPGPILFRQTRHGFNNRPIKVWKFRSMHADRCDPTAVRAVRREDDRVTRVGRVIRRTSLDELPQLFNVLSGQLSMVGPRPHATAARTGDILYDEVTAAYSARHRVKPGITGWAQINGWRGELNTAEKITQRVAHDLYYIENWSLWFDLMILLRTPGALVGAKNAY